MLIGVTGLCVALGWIVRDVQLDQAALKRLEREGVSFYVADLDPSTKGRFYGTLLGMLNVKYDFDTVGDFDGPVSDLNDVARFPSVMSIRVENSPALSDLSPLARLPKLKRLYISNCSVTSLDPLSGLANLTNVDISNNEITDISPLAKSTNISRLDLNRTGVVDLSPLQKMELLEFLDASQSDVHDITPLASCKKLKKLNVSETDVSNIKPLRALTSLERLNVSKTKIAELDGIENCKNLSHLFASETSVSDLSLLENLNLLTSVTLAHTQVESIGFLRNSKLVYLALEHSKVQDLHGLTAGVAQRTLFLKVGGPDFKTLDGVSQINGLRELVIEDATDLDLTHIVPSHGNLNLHILMINDSTISNWGRMGFAKRLGKLHLVNTNLKSVAGFPKLSKLIELVLSGSPIENLDGIDKIKNLRRLTLDGTNIDDVSELSKTRKIQTLSLANTSVTDVSPLQHLRELKQLVLTNTQARQLSPLFGLKKLESVDLSGIHGKDLQCMKGLEMTEVVLKNVELKSLDGLEFDAQSLFNNRLNLAGSTVEDFSVLKNPNCQGIRHLDLSGSNFSDLNLLTEMGLYSLDISNSSVETLRPLHKQVFLKSLRVIGLSLSRKEIADLKRRLPKCSMILEDDE